jgi:(E)-4-hydroxy-3-methylbut-2-enyl-diphosphate synthase
MYSAEKLSMKQLRGQMLNLVEHKIDKPVVFIINSTKESADQHLIHYATEAGALLLDGFGDGLILGVDYSSKKTLADVEQANLNAFGILQATRVRISKTEYISCPSCGRTLFDLQETTAKIRARTNHLKGVKIGIMGCIVNGPGEMADADFGYVGSGVGKITLYKGQEVVKRSIPSDIAVDELINLIKENDAWVEPSLS